MRIPLVVLVVFLLLPIPPAAAGDECSTNAGSARLCVTLPVPRPNPPPGLPNAPPQTEPYFDTYYLWLDAGRCAQAPISNGCRGQPAAPGAGVRTPAGPVGLGAFGTLYEESNGISGLQRSDVTLGGMKRPPDRIVLV